MADQTPTVIKRYTLEDAFQGVEVLMPEGAIIHGVERKPLGRGPLGVTFYGVDLVVMQPEEKPPHPLLQVVRRFATFEETSTLPRVGMKLLGTVQIPDTALGQVTRLQVYELVLGERGRAEVAAIQDQAREDLSTHPEAWSPSRVGEQQPSRVEQLERENAQLRAERVYAERSFACRCFSAGKGNCPVHDRQAPAPFTEAALIFEHTRKEAHVPVEQRIVERRLRDAALELHQVEGCTIEVAMERIRKTVIDAVARRQIL